MTARDIMLALIGGKKVGSSPYRYMYLNIDGHLQVEYDTESDLFEFATEVVGKLLHLEDCKIQPEDG